MLLGSSFRSVVSIAVAAALVFAPVSATAAPSGLLQVNFANSLHQSAEEPSSAHVAHILIINDPAEYTVKGKREVFAPHTKARAKWLTGEAGKYWLGESRGLMTSFTIKSTTSAELSGACNKNPDQIWDFAEDEVSPAGVKGETPHLVVFLPEKCEQFLGYSGRATRGWGIGDGQGQHVTIVEDSLPVTVHELGHNLGLGHSNLELKIGSTTRVTEYLGLYGPQGMGLQGYDPGVLDVGFQHQLGIAGEQSVRALQPRSRTTATLTSVSGSASALQGLTFTHPKNKQQYFIEYRSGTGRDSKSYYAERDPTVKYNLTGTVDFRPGVRIYRMDRKEPSTTRMQHTITLSRLINGKHRTTVVSGETFASPDKSFSVRVGKIQNGKAVVTVDLAPSSTTLSVKKSTYGKKATATVKVKGASTATGKVAIYRGSKKLTTGTLKKGVATVNLPATLAAGKVKLQARYLGSSNLNSSNSSIKTLTVARAKAKVKVLKTKNLKKGKKATVTLRLTGVAKTSPTGKVKLKVGKKTVSKATKVKKVKGKWRVTIKTKKLPKGKVTVVYSGNKNLKRATYSAKRTLR